MNCRLCSTAAFLVCLLFGGRLHAQAPPLAAAPHAAAPKATAPAATEAHWLKQGQAAEAAKDYPVAIAFYQKAGMLAPHDVAPITALTKADQEAGRFAAAAALLQRKRPTFPKRNDQRRLRLALADLQYAWAQSLLHNSPTQSLPHSEAALAIDRSLRPAQAADDLREIGVAYMDLSQYGKALDSYQQALPLVRQVGDRGSQYAQQHRHCLRPPRPVRQGAGLLSAGRVPGETDRG